jgi:hypothetical protein
MQQKGETLARDGIRQFSFLLLDEIHPIYMHNCPGNSFQAFASIFGLLQPIEAQSRSSAHLQHIMEQLFPARLRGITSIEAVAFSIHLA